MAKVARARAVAADLAGEIRRRDAHARDVLRTSSLVEALDARDRALASRLVLGLVGTWGYVRQAIERHVSGHVEPKVLDALCVSAYELLFLDTASAVAASQGVELVRRVRPRAAGLANAVLRKVAREDAPLRRAALERVEAGPAGSLSVEDLALVAGYPTWLVERVRQERGAEAARAMALASLLPAPVYVAPNACRHTVRETRELLAAAGLAPTEVEGLDAFELGQPAGLAGSGAVEAADVVVADLSAQRVVSLLDLKPGMRVLEVGQGRGTKSVLMQNAAQAAGGAAQVVGIEVEPYKVEVAQRRMERAGLAACVRSVAYDACRLADDEVPPALFGPFDLVFVDAPCSGTGTLRRHPEISWRLAPHAVDASAAESLPALQLRMLRAAASRVRAGGRLAYATCSVFRAENEDVVEAFLASEVGAGFELVGEPFQSLPQPGGPDGHFLARFTRRT